MSSLLVGAVMTTTTVQAKTYRTNPWTLRHHRYWYSYQQDVNGHWHYSRLHFTKKTVYFADKTKRTGKWHHSHISPQHYFVTKHNGWYNFGYKGTDIINTYVMRAEWKNLDGHRHWTLGSVDFSNNRGGLQVDPPFTTWIYTTYLNSEGWYYDLTHEPNFR
ncbi:hypothetical protein FD25_GL002398 [Levilactobacillus acidifarinae DSM 19394]|uniref:Uncharacterized protein n=1 Tax=Levilactobacillus acidifarinae DSM 19394 = JCM 15949 TaxID=1423715 RepID=A0A0R1LSS5_9LACO|nr:hypothetical protein FD25_GL002398 [Levilactobacillus acidifarinae DSM 19394]